eukprot:gnl/TRDRNA2_/TRDRNA2_120827_c0_seq1.p2 gnl/TRDRNA2_/TRDRNA2_120827_c0~~gnl/TRDRNA2_/TRDRNA2_120827_c0_seq1.p2  ORF type:complete len:101 (+),score=21.64 gnl/TRDRNA2_/TRDRNA2_120827_c0_seq1:129-431(+)
MEWCSCDFKAQSIAISAWAFSTAVQWSTELVWHALANMAEQRIRDFNAQGLFNTAWAFTSTRHMDQKLLTILARAAEQGVGDFKVQELSTTMWAFALAHA